MSNTAHSICIIHNQVGRASGMTSNL